MDLDKKEIAEKEAIKPLEAKKKTVKATVKKTKVIALKDFSLGGRSSKNPKRTYKKGDTLELTDEQIKGYKKNNLI